MTFRNTQKHTNKKLYSSEVTSTICQITNRPCTMNLTSIREKLILNFYDFNEQKMQQYCCDKLGQPFAVLDQRCISERKERYSLMATVGGWGTRRWGALGQGGRRCRSGGRCALGFFGPCRRSAW